MAAFDPDALAASGGGRWSRRPSAPIAGFAVDTRSLRPGQAFVALRTERRDGHDFLEQAAAAGSPAALVSRERPEAALAQLVVADPLAAFQAAARARRREFRGPVAAVTGSAGKTSTKDLLALLLGGAEAGVLATEGNLNNHLGVPLTLARLDPAAHRFAVVEAGISAPGEMAPLAAMIEPDLVIVTLVAPAHLEELGGLEGVAREKAALPAALRPGGKAFLPAEVAALPAFRALAAERVVLDPAAGFAVEHGAGETRVRLPGAGDFALPRVSDGMARNAALALSAALHLGTPAADLRARLARWRPAPLRGEWRRDGHRLLYLDCYNANPASMADALDAFRGGAPESEPRLFVLGGMEELGPEAGRYHRALGRSLRLRAGDRLVAVGPQAGAVLAGALEAGHRPEQLEAVEDAEGAAARAAGFRGAVFVKGSRRYALERVAGREAAHA